MRVRVADRVGEPVGIEARLARCDALPRVAGFREVLSSPPQPWRTLVQSTADASLCKQSCPVDARGSRHASHPDRRARLHVDRPRPGRRAATAEDRWNAGLCDRDRRADARSAIRHRRADLAHRDAHPRDAGAPGRSRQHAAGARDLVEHVGRQADLDVQAAPGRALPRRHAVRRRRRQGDVRAHPRSRDRLAAPFGARRHHGDQRHRRPYDRAGHQGAVRAAAGADQRLQSGDHEPHAGAEDGQRAIASSPPAPGPSN